MQSDFAEERRLRVVEVEGRRYAAVTAHAGLARAAVCLAVYGDADDPRRDRVAVRAPEPEEEAEAAQQVFSGGLARLR